jgi:tyrosinase
MPLPNAGSLDYTPNDMTDFSKQNYTYDDFAPAVAAPPPGDRLLRLGASAATVASGGLRAMTKPTPAELVGASAGGLNVVGSQAEASVHLDQNVRNKVAMSLTSAAEGGSPDRIYLNLENITGLTDATAFRVYVGLPQGADPAQYPDRLAGSIALFGVRKASVTDDQHAGQGLTYVLDITNIVDALHLNNALDVESLGVRIVPVNPVPQSAKINIGRVSIFRQNP